MAAPEKLSSAMEDYLEAIFVLSEKGQGARAGDIAEHLHVHKSTTTAALRILAEKDLIQYQVYKPVTLTSQGKRLGAQIFRRHETLRCFLTQVLNVEASLAAETACRMEHVIPTEVIDRFAAFEDHFDQFPDQEIFKSMREKLLKASDSSSKLPSMPEKEDLPIQTEGGSK